MEKTFCLQKLSVKNLELLNHLLGGWLDAFHSWMNFLKRRTLIVLEKNAPPWFSGVLHNWVKPVNQESLAHRQLKVL